MKCSTCGDSLSPDARFCPRCGTRAVWEGQAGGPLAQGYTSAQGCTPAQGYNTFDRVSRHLQILSVLWLVYAGLRLGWSPFGSLLLASLWPVALAAVLLGAGTNLLTGYALFTRRRWGRVLAIVFGVMVLIHPPLGTALGIYTLWVLAPRLSGEEYAALADAAG